MCNQMIVLHHFTLNDFHLFHNLRPINAPFTRVLPSNSIRIQLNLVLILINCLSKWFPPLPFPLAHIIIALMHNVTETILIRLEYVKFSANATNVNAFTTSKSEEEVILMADCG